MILSSADILRILSGDAIVREEAELKIVEGRPGVGVGDKVYIYIDKYPTIDEFEATWNIWVQDNSGMGSYVLNAMTVLLPNFDFNGKHHTTTDFASDRTVVKPQEEIDREEFKSRFSGLQKGLEDRLSAVRNGIDGKDGKDGIDGLPGRDGKDGKDGRDGRDIDAADTELFDLKDVEQGIQVERGQVLTWDGTKWTNLYVRQTMSAGGAAGGGGGSSDVQVLNDLNDVTTDGVENGQFLQYNAATGEWEPVTVAPGSGLQPGDNVSELTNDAGYITDAGVTQIIAGDNITIDPAGGTGAVTITSTGGGSGDVEEAPQDGNYYVRQNGAWVDLSVALSALQNRTVDGGNFTTGSSDGDADIVDGGDFNSGSAQYGV